MDEKTKVPLIWLIASVVTSVSAASIGLRWTFMVDERLSRIEEKLGIPKPYGANAAERPAPKPRF